MSFARARKRKLKKDARKGDSRAQRQLDRANKNIRMTDAQRLRLEDEYRKEVLNNLWLIYQYTLHKYFQFGKSRLLRLRDKTWSELEAILSGNVNVKEIDQFLRGDMKFDCGLSRYDKNADRCKQIEDAVIRELSAAVIMALLDEFDFKSKRLEKVCHCAFEVNNKLESGELTYREINFALDKVMTRGNKSADKDAGKGDTVTAGSGENCCKCD